MMKHFLASTLLFTSIFTMAQQPFKIQRTQNQLDVNYIASQNTFIGQNGLSFKTAAAASGGDTIFYEDFSGSLNGWVNNTQIGPTGTTWIWSSAPPTGQYTNEPLILSTTRNNGVAQLNCDGFNTPGSASTFQKISASLTSPAINTLGYPIILLEFEHYFRPFTDAQLTVGVSSDGTNYIEFDVRNGVPTNSASANRVIERIDVSQFIGNKATAFIRFSWKNESHYFWQIDDVKLLTPPKNDLQMDRITYTGLLDSSGFDFHYTQIPLKQANNTEMFFGGVFTNLGTATQHNTKVIAHVNGPSISYTEQSSGVSIGYYTTASKAVVTPFKPLGAQGIYNITIEAQSDSVDQVPGNNELTASFRVTDTVYARDKNLVQYINQRTTGRILANRFDFTSDDTITSFSCYIGSSSTSSSIGNQIKMFLFDSAFTKVEESAVHTITTNGYQRLPIPKTHVVSGTYYVGIEAVTNFAWIGIDNGIHPPKNTTFENIGAATGTGVGGTWFSNNFTSVPYIRLNVVPFNCVPFIPTITSNPTSNCGAADGSLAVHPVKGTGPYTYQWAPLETANTIGAGQGTDSISGLKAGGYSVTITDANNCTESYEFFVSDAGAPILKFPEIIREDCFGDENGKLKANYEGGTPPLNFSWSNGQSGINLDTITNLKAGSYSVTITDGGSSGCTTAKSYNVPGPTTPLTSSFFPNAVTCDTCENGLFTMFIVGGVAPYKYVFAGPTHIPSGELKNTNENLTVGNLKPGTYNAVITDGHGCIFQTTVDILPYQPNSVTEQSNQKELIVVPNPFDDQVFIEVPRTTKQFNISIFDVIGNQLLQKQIIGFNQNISLEHLPAGTYFISITVNNQTTVKKLMKF